MKIVRSSPLLALMTLPIVLLLGSCAAKGATTSTASTAKLKSSVTTVKASAATAKVSATTASATTAKASASTAKARATTASATTVKGSTATTSTATTVKGAATTAAATPSLKKGKVASSLPTVPAPVTTLKQGSGSLGTLKPVTTVRPTVTIPPVTVAAGSAPAKPEDRNCGDFDNWADAKQFFDTYYPYYGDVAHLDNDGDGIPCESLSGSPK